MKLTDDITILKGMGEKLAEKFHRLDIYSIRDLLHHYPRSYDDYSKIIKIRNAALGPATFHGQIKEVKNHRSRNGLLITTARIADDSGQINATWFNQSYLMDSLPKDTDIYLSGELKFSGNRISLQHPTIEKVSEFTTSTARIVPKYPETKGLSSRQIRAFIKQIIHLCDDIPEILPKDFVAQHNLPSRGDALRQIHFPETAAELETAKQRLAFVELLLINLATLQTKQELSDFNAPVIGFDEQLMKEFVDSLQFKLTDAQRRVAWEAILDIGKSNPMNRLVEGDVGSGKTIIAAMLTVLTVKSGYQVALMAPTEILATQLAETITELLAKYDLNIALIKGGKSSGKSETVANVSSGDVQVAVGTHALLQEGVEFDILGLVIVDEQHRFGVRQREALHGKAAELFPHMLSMSATPIPRTLALTVYGELSLSVIDELPPGRKPVITKAVSYSDRNQVYAQLLNQLRKGRQAYVICALIEPSDKLGVRSATEEFEHMQKVFPDQTIGLLHGKLKAADKAKIMTEFKDGDIDILVSTTVVEVGVNVPNATIMLIEGAERFGLAQLHQLRGRIRRGSEQGYCYLITSKGIGTNQRLKAMEKTDDGFELAELDLQIRGPGAVYGTQQSGLVDLEFADLSDARGLSRMQNIAQAFLEDYNLLHYPQLNERVKALRSRTILN